MQKKKDDGKQSHIMIGKGVGRKECKKRSQGRGVVW